MSQLASRCSGPAVLGRLLATFALLLIAFGANAESGDGICAGS